MEGPPSTSVGDAERYGVKRSLRFLKKKLAWQREAPLLTPLSRRVEMWHRGFRETSYTLYDLDNARPGAYLPDSARLDAFFINGKLARNVLNDKLLFGSLLHRHLPVPTTLALIERGKVYAPGCAGDIVSLAQTHGSVILKPASGSRGLGVHRLAAEDDLTFDGRATTPDAVHAFVRSLDDYLVTEAVTQAAYARVICAETTNTVRVLTLIDPDTAEPFVACVVHRFGTPTTAPVDGWSRGGLACGCNPATGVIGPGVKSLKLTNGELRWYSHHPDTGAAIEGVRIPHWDEIRAGLLDAVCASFPELRRLGRRGDRRRLCGH